ncbi:MAG: AbrB/MazE/SpoVT family DNA-binding domain-containing protein [Dethiobacteria bacterium]
MSKPRHKFYAAVTLGERGQIVIPREAREEMELQPGEKLLVFQGPKGMGLSIMPARKVSAFIVEAMERLSQLNMAALNSENEVTTEDPSTSTINPGEVDTDETNEDN